MSENFASLRTIISLIPTAGFMSWSLSTQTCKSTRAHPQPFWPCSYLHPLGHRYHSPEKESSIDTPSIVESMIAEVLNLQKLLDLSLEVESQHNPRVLTCWQPWKTGAACRAMHRVTKQVRLEEDLRIEDVVVNMGSDSCLRLIRLWSLMLYNDSVKLLRLSIRFG